MRANRPNVAQLRRRLFAAVNTLRNCHPGRESVSQLLSTPRSRHIDVTHFKPGQVDIEVGKEIDKALQFDREYIAIPTSELG